MVWYPEEFNYFKQSTSFLWPLRFVRVFREIRGENAIVFFTTDYTEYTEKSNGRGYHEAGASSTTWRCPVKENSGIDRERRFWQPSRHPVGIQTEKFWRQKLDYLHENPVRKGLVCRSKHWRFSSALWYDTDGQQTCDVHLTGINWT